MSRPKEPGLPKFYLMEQKKCALWHKGCGHELGGGIQSGHGKDGPPARKGMSLLLDSKERGINMVVHGDDLAALGLTGDLTWYEETEAESESERTIKKRLRKHRAIQ